MAPERQSGPVDLAALAREARDSGRAAPDVSRRPTLPDRPQPMAADIEDEEADPVIDSGPGIADGAKSIKKQRG